MSRFLTLFLLILPHLHLSSQSLVVDHRDGQSYTIVEIGEYRFFGENLRYAAPGSYILDEKGANMCDEGNYYTLSSLDSVCPSGSHIMTEDEWLGSIQHLLNHNRMSLSDMEKSYTSDANTFALLRDTTNRLDIFAQSELGLEAHGWVQGRKIRNTKSLALWVWSKDDSKMHLHIGPDGFMRHAHDHHILDKPRRTRRFNVRCVLD